MGEENIKEETSRKHAFIWCLGRRSDDEGPNEWPDNCNQNSPCLQHKTLIWVWIFICWMMNKICIARVLKYILLADVSIFILTSFCLSYLSDQLLCTMIHLRTLTEVPIQTGRIANIPRDERVVVQYVWCSQGDEFYHMFECKYFVRVRDTYIPQYFNRRLDI